MANEHCISDWRIIGASMKGASHKRSDRPNQDAIKQFPELCDSLPLIVAVSDGHGSTKYFRSDKGAQFAVEAAIDTLRRFQENPAGFSTSSKLELQEQLGKSLVNTWRSKVEADLQEEPFKIEELTFVEEKEGERARDKVVRKPVLAYGATILATMITESYIVYLQLGDGDILSVSEQGKTAKVIPDHELHFANETTSLCGSDPWVDCQFRIDKLSPTTAPPALILLCTDGYRNSFSSEGEFFKVGPDLLEMLQADKAEEIKSKLPGWLEEATQIGSGDDITLGMLYRMNSFKQTIVPEPIAQEQEQQEQQETVDHQEQRESQEQIVYTEGENLGNDAESSYRDESMQP